MTDQNPYSQQQEEPKKKKPWWKRWWVILIAVLILAGIGNAVTDGENNGADSDSGQPTAEQAPAEDKQEEESRQEEDPANEETPQQEEAQPKEEKKNTVSVAGQDWECQPVPDETMQRIMGGDKWDDGAHATVDKAVMVQGADNNFIAAISPGKVRTIRLPRTSPHQWTVAARLLPPALAPRSCSTGRKRLAVRSTAPTPLRNASRNKTGGGPTELCSKREAPLGSRGDVGHQQYKKTRPWRSTCGSRQHQRRAGISNPTTAANSTPHGNTTYNPTGATGKQTASNPPKCKHGSER